VEKRADEHFLAVCRYVERNPLWAGLCRRAENWHWSSLWRREHEASEEPRVLLAAGPARRSG
jgi:REP-associated tyrosine transposase